MTLRFFCVFVHRYAGLAMAAFLVIAGLTGAFLPFYHALDRAANPALYTPAPHAAGAVPLSPIELRQRLEDGVPGVQVPYVPLDTPPEHAVEFFVRPAIVSPPQTPAALENDQYFLDPYSGRILGGRKRGDLRQGAKNLLPFLYRLHYSLNLGPAGRTVFGLVALLWTIDCFVGAYLTFPPRRRTDGSAEPRSGWWPRWGRAWLVKTGHFYKLTFTWHQASGLWVWGMLLVFAWSAVALNLGEVYHPLMNAAFGMKAGPFETLPRLERPQPVHALSWGEARERGRALMDLAAAERGIGVEREIGLSYIPSHGMFRYVVRSTRDVNERYANTAVWFDGDSGRETAFEAPTGEAAGNTLNTWLYALHFADVGGWPYKVFVSILGLVVTLLTVSGVVVWWKKRQARRCRRRGVSSAGDTDLEDDADPVPLLTET